MIGDSVVVSDVLIVLVSDMLAEVEALNWLDNVVVSERDDSDSELDSRGVEGSLDVVV